MKWTEISNEPQNKRFEALSYELKLSKFENEFIPTELPMEYRDRDFFLDEENCDQFKSYLAKLKKDFDQIRVGGFFKENMDLFSNEYPAELLQIKTFDSLVHSEERWWPRNQLFHSLIHFLSQDVKQVDFSAPILVAGANPDTKTVIAAFIKMGFSKFNVTDVNSQSCQKLVEDMRKKFFSTKFEMTEMNFITQLPNIYSMGINTLAGDLDETTKMSLIYFNFLPKGAFWIETTPRKSSVLADEAISFGFQVRIGTEVASNQDSTWSSSVLNCDIDVARLKESLNSLDSFT